MDNFVIGDDAAHVVLEWIHVRTGDRVLTGKTLQRRRAAPPLTGSSSTGGRCAPDLRWRSPRSRSPTTAAGCA